MVGNEGLHGHFFRIPLEGRRVDHDTCNLVWLKMGNPAVKHVEMLLNVGYHQQKDREVTGYTRVYEYWTVQYFNILPWMC